MRGFPSWSQCVAQLWRSVYIEMRSARSGAIAVSSSSAAARTSRLKLEDGRRAPGPAPNTRSEGSREGGSIHTSPEMNGRA